MKGFDQGIDELYMALGLTLFFYNLHRLGWLKLETAMLDNETYLQIKLQYELKKKR